MSSSRSFLRIGLTAVLLVAGVLLTAGHSRQSSTSAPSASACSASAIALAYQVPVSFQQYGCEQGWAYTWATIGRGVRAVGVTDLLELSRATHSWTFASRLIYCVPNNPNEKSRYLPQGIYLKACFSN